MKYNVVKMEKKKMIALVAHDNMKDELLEWVGNNKETFSLWNWDHS